MIYTFYSYKGGVGRTMALANIAELFYQAGLKVLMVDWDLEAPGLERFFPTLLQGNILEKRGIMDMLLKYKTQMSQELPDSEQEPISLLESPKELIVDVYPDNPSQAKLSFLPSGRRSDEHFTTYANAVLTFDWQDFYENWEGERYFDWLRQEFENIADIILIDSRTGVTEMGGVCTYQLADVVVMFCATNQQNLHGIYRMARNFKRTELIPLRHGRSLEVLIVPARLEDAEGNALNQFKRDFTTRFEEFVPAALADSAQIFWDLAIPYVPYYAYNERVAVREPGEAIAESIVESFENLARVLNPAYTPATKSAQWSISSRHITSNEINTTDSVILDELAEWALVQEDTQYILDVLDTVFNNLDEYRLTENENSLHRAGLDWQRHCVTPLKFMFQKWNLQYAYTPEFDLLREKIADMDTIMPQIMGDVDNQQFTTLHFWFIELKALLWNILTVANKRIVLLVNTLRSLVRR
ncbi:MAG: KGGVGR-motif variant AAA ATPase [Ardenticatenaceae bacterium]